MQRPNAEKEGSFPPVDKVMPAFKAGDDKTFTAAFNARYLAELATAMGSGEHVVLTFSTKDRFAPIAVRPGSAANPCQAILMPIRL